MLYYSRESENAYPCLQALTGTKQTRMSRVWPYARFRMKRCRVGTASGFVANQWLWNSRKLWAETSDMEAVSCCKLAKRAKFLKLHVGVVGGQCAGDCVVCSPSDVYFQGLEMVCGSLANFILSEKASFGRRFHRLQF